MSHREHVPCVNMETEASVDVLVHLNELGFFFRASFFTRLIDLISGRET